MGNPPSAADLTVWALGNSRSGVSSIGSGSVSSYRSSQSHRSSSGGSSSRSHRHSSGAKQGPSHQSKRIDGRVNPRTPERAAARAEWKSATSSSSGVELTHENVGSGGYRRRRRQRQRRQLLEKKTWQERPGIERPVVVNVGGGGEGWLKAQSEAHKQRAIEEAIKADAAAALGARKDQASSNGEGSNSKQQQAQMYKAMGWSTQLSERQLQMASMECSASLRRLVSAISIEGASATKE